MKPKALVIRTAGTNCDMETVYALKTAGAAVALEHINHLKTRRSLSSYKILAIPGGFSYGDDIAAGKVFSLEIKLWFRDAIKKFVDRGGLVIGICNGFQVLVKTGMLPDVDFEQTVSLIHNDCGCFQAKHVRMSVQKDARSKGAPIWLNGLPDEIVMPMAHGEGKFYAELPVLKRIEDNAQVAFRYISNPNGSLNDIAGIFDSTGQILGLMPHPERIMFPQQSLEWTAEQPQTWGQRIFKNAVDYCTKG